MAYQKRMKIPFCKINKIHSYRISLCSIQERNDKNPQSEFKLQDFCKKDLLFLYDCTFLDEIIFYAIYKCSIRNVECSLILREEKNRRFITFIFVLLSVFYLCDHLHLHRTCFNSLLFYLSWFEKIFLDFK